MIIITLIAYIINQNNKSEIDNDIVYWFMNCYFNDIIGSITFVSYCNILCAHFKKTYFSKLLHIELLMLFCGLFWEVITPLFRKNTVADFFDIIAYCFGGLIYWLISQKIMKTQT